MNAALARAWRRGDHAYIERQVADYERSRKVKRQKSKPRREAKEAKRELRVEKVSRIRREVERLSGGRCEVCFIQFTDWAPMEMHHVLSGSDRRKKEAVETCAALCRGCHRLVTMNDERTLYLVGGIGRLSVEARRACDRRAAKVRRMGRVQRDTEGGK